MHYVLHQAQCIGTALNWKLYHHACCCFAFLVKKAKAITRQDFYAFVNKFDMWRHILYIVKPQQRLRIENLYMADDGWALEDASKAEILHRQCFPSG